MRKYFLSLSLATSMLFTTVAPVAANAAERVHHYRTYRQRAHRKTLKRVGVGAAGGAVVGALVGHGKGAGIGAVAGAGAGYLYDRHKKHEGQP